MNKNPLLVPELREMLASGDAKALGEVCSAAHPAFIAELISALSPAEAWAVVRSVDRHLRAEIFSHLDEEFQVEIVENLNRGDVARLLTDMSPDDRADLVKRLPEERREMVLPGLAQAEREDIRRLTSYAEGTAGAVMTSDYATLTPGLTVAQAIERLRQVAPDRETIYYAYIVDENRRLLGFVSLRDLIIAPRTTMVDEIMHRDAVTAQVDEDQEQVARKIQKYDLIALPVLTAEGALVGIVTHDDAVDILVQEQQEDLEKLMAIAGKHESGSYLRTPALTHFRNRVYWVVSLAVLSLISGFIIHRFEHMLAQVIILALYMPMLAATGGNTGSQSAAVVVRALALREIMPGDALRVLFKELRIAIMLSGVLGLLTWGRVAFFSWGSELPTGLSLARVGVAIALALGLQVVSATMIGALLPLGATKLKLDPAVVASPALATMVDITGLLIYFTTAQMVLGV
ncbi:MAG: magnesium transporter [Lentisphaeria bacterium]|jgi:magnesium transporter|nr:magnesium transporter [Lentisphaeria bacterium]